MLLVTNFYGYKIIEIKGRVIFYITFLTWSKIRISICFIIFNDLRAGKVCVPAAKVIVLNLNPFFKKYINISINKSVLLLININREDYFHNNLEVWNYRPNIMAYTWNVETIK